MFRLLWKLIKFLFILAFWPLFAVRFIIKGLFFIGLIILGAWAVLGLLGLITRRPLRWLQR